MLTVSSQFTNLDPRFPATIGREKWQNFPAAIVAAAAAAAVAAAAGAGAAAATFPP